MTQVTNVRAVRPVALTTTYRAWKLVNGVHYPLRIDGSTLENVKAEAQDACSHKEQFVVLESDNGKHVVRIYQIKQGKAEYRYVGGSAVRMAQLKAELVTEFQVEHYAPKEAWHWSPGADVVGRDAGGVVNG